MPVSDFVQVRLYGGLGNQLFQFFAGLDLASDRKCRLALDLSWLNEYSKLNHVFTDPILQEIDFPIDIVDSQDTSIFDKRLGNGILRRLRIPSVISHKHLPTEVGFTELYKLPHKIELRGYYQSYKYYKRVIEKLPLDGPSQHQSDVIDNSESRGIALHIRGGDYLDSKDLFSQLGIKYYNEAVRTAREFCPDNPIILFTNDAAHAAKILTDSAFEYSIFDDKGMKPREILEAISNSSAIIGANSTFSYWAALKNSKEIPKIFPSKWFQNHKLPNELYPKEWIILE